MNRLKQTFSIVVAGCVAFANVPSAFADQSAQYTSAPTVASPQRTPTQMDQLVAPIALYPDALVDQILVAASYPEEIGQAERWMQRNSGLDEDQLAREVDTQPWDPSVKALTEVPAVLANMDQNRSWTAALGEAYRDRESEVMDAIQVLRQRAEQVGNLESNAQQTVTTSGNRIVIEPADPQIVYVPQYDPWLAYGAPIGVWPGWYGYPGLFWSGPGIGFGVGFGFGGFHRFGGGFHDGGFRGGVAVHRGGFQHGDFHGGGVHRGGFHGGGVHGGVHSGGVHGGNFHGGGGGFHGGGGRR